MKYTVLIALLLTAILSGCQNEKKADATQHWDTARTAVLTALAKNQLDAGDFDKCKQTLTQALSMQPANASLRILLARVDIESSQLQEASDQLAAAGKLDEKNAEVDYLQGVVAQRWQKPADALAAYTKASDKNPNELAYILAKAEMCVAVGHSDEAVAALQACGDRFEHEPMFYQTLGELLSDQKQYPAAIKNLRQADRLSPNDPTIREKLALTLYYNKEYRESADLLSTLTRDGGAKRADLWLALGECQMQLSQVREARDSFDLATQVDPKSAPAWLSLAKASMALGDGRRADTAARQSLTLDASNVETHLLIGFLHLRQRDYSIARGEFEKAAALDHNDSLPVCMIGYVLEKSGQSKSAIKFYAQALQIRPDDALAGKLLASAETGN